MVNEHAYLDEVDLQALDMHLLYPQVMHFCPHSILSDVIKERGWKHV